MDFLPSFSCMPSPVSSIPGVVFVAVFACVEKGPLAAMYEVQVIMRYELQEIVSGLKLVTRC